MSLALAAWRIGALKSFGSAYLGGYERDAGLYVWLAQVARDALASDAFFESKAFYPYGHGLAWSDNFILPSLAIGALSACGIPLAAAYNALILGACLANGFLCQRLAYMVSGALAPSLLAGFGMLFSSYLAGHLGHPQLQFAAVVPLSAILFLSHLESRNPLHALLCGASIFMGFLCGVNHAIIALLCLCLLGSSAALLRPAIAGPRYLVSFAAPFAIGIAPVIPFALPYTDVRATFGQRQIYEAYYFSANLLSYLSATPLNWLYSWSSALGHSEANLFSSLTLYVCGGAAFCFYLPRGWARYSLAACLAAAGAASLPPFGLRLLSAVCTWLALPVTVIALRRGRSSAAGEPLQRRELGAVFLCTAICLFLISLGPLGNPEKGEPAVALYRLFYELFPGFDSVRAVSRVGLGAIVFLYVAVAAALAGLKAPPAVSIALTLLCVAENLCPVYPFEPALARPQALESLCGSADRRPAIVLPFSGPLDERRQVASWSEFARLNVNYMNWTAGCGVEIVNGYSGQRSKLMLELPAKLRDFPDRRSIAALGEIAGLAHIVLAPPYASPELIERLGDFPELSSVVTLPDGSAIAKFEPRLDLRKGRTLYAPAQSSRLKLELEASAPATIEITVIDPNTERILSKETSRLNVGYSRAGVDLPLLRQKVRPYRVTISLPDSSVEAYLVGSDAISWRQRE